MIYVCVFLTLIGFYYCIRNKKISFDLPDKLLAKIFLLILVADLLAAGMEIKEYSNEQLEDVKRIQRDSYDGQTRWEIYDVQIGKGKEETVEVEISPQVYNEKMLEELSNQLLEELDTVILGKNRSLGQITQNITLPRSLEGYPFAISWELSRYDVLDLSGNLYQKEIIEKDPKNGGIPVTLKAYLKYEDFTKEYHTELMVFASQQPETVKDALESMVESADRATKKEAYLVLPEDWNGKELVWKKADTPTGKYILLLSVVIGGLLIWDERQKKKTNFKIWKDEMLRDYPEIIGQFTLLLNAGMTTKNVWGKMVDDYRRQKKLSGKSRAAYEEMLYTWQEMQSGIPEAECYERFGKRCELLPYMKLGALLAQNLRKGARGIAEMLHMEAIEAMDERKNRAKRLGEEAGTKLLVPMTVMLVVVLAIVVVPAFWAASI